MERKTILQKAAYIWIHQLPPGTVFHLSQLYADLEAKFPEWCNQRGDATTEQRYQNDARWGVKNAHFEGLIEPTEKKKKSGEYRRVAK